MFSIFLFLCMLLIVLELFFDTCAQVDSIASRDCLPNTTRNILRKLINEVYFRKFSLPHDIHTPFDHPPCRQLMNISERLNSISLYSVFIFQYFNHGNINFLLLIKNNINDFNIEQY